MRYEFLPPYSPDYNPIEPAFSKIKAYVRRHGDAYRAATESTQDRLNTMILLHEAVWAVNTDDAAGWFHHSGYF